MKDRPQTTAEAFEELRRAWRELVLAFAKALGCGRVVELLAKALRRVTSSREV